MGMGPIIWTCLALTAHQSNVPEYFINSRDSAIGITLNPKRANEVKKVNLLVSSDRGASWSQADSKLPTEKAFVFRAPQDGRYLFIIQEEDAAGKPSPVDPARVKPNQILIVDTVRPNVQITADRLPSGEVRVHWIVTDQSADAGSVRLEYHTSGSPESQWTPVLVSPPLKGNHTFNPGQAGVAGPVRVRVRAKDQAENVGEGEATVAAAEAAATAAPTQPVISLIPNVRPDQPAPPNQLTSQQSMRPSLEAPPPGPATISATPPAPPAEMIGRGPAPPSGFPIAANNDRMPAPIGNLVDMPGNASAVKIVKDRDVSLNFTVAKIGPSGLGNADVWVTIDRGANWKKLPSELPVILSQAGDVRNAESVSGAVRVQLPADGVLYGFLVAVKSKAGRAPPPPKAGDAPEVLVELDVTAPKGQLFAPQPDPSQPNTLLLAWEARDHNLSDKPITLEWSEKRDGPWNLIGEGPLPNSGQYPWRLPSSMPPSVYLRLTMRDLAGNEARAQTDKPVLIDLSVPQTRITGVAAGSR